MVGNGTRYEDEVVEKINEFIQRRPERQVNLTLGSFLYPSLTQALKVTKSIKKLGDVKTDPKADIIICRDPTNPLGEGSIYISHKKAGGPEAFQQYGGLSEKASLHIYYHTEVQKFLEQTSSLVKSTNEFLPVMKSIKDISLSEMAIFGSDVGGEFSLNHVQVIGQGDPLFWDRGNDIFHLSFSHHSSTSKDLRHFVEGYEPVLGATFRRKRCFYYNGERFSNVRLGIYPRRMLSGRTGIIDLT